MKVVFYGYTIDITEEKKNALKEMNKRGRGCASNPFGDNCKICPLRSVDGACLPCNIKHTGISADSFRDKLIPELYKIVFARYVQEEMEL